MGTLTVSAVIPTYNGTHYLVEAVQSALAQTYPLLEIIVVDDGSREDIRGLLAPFGSRVTYLRQENAGPAAARNRGILLARGDAIALLDDDDRWHPHKTAEQVRLLALHPECGMVYSEPEWIDEQGEVVPHQSPAELPSGRVYRKFLTRNRIATPSVTLIRRAALAAVGLFDESPQCISCEDYDLWVRIAARYEVRCCPGVLVSYRLRQAGLSQNLDRHLQANLFVLDKLAARQERGGVLAESEFRLALETNRYHLYRRFAYSYYYLLDRRDEARRLVLKALLLRPCCLRDLWYLVLFWLPGGLFRSLRGIKQRLLQPGEPCGLLGKAD